MTLVLVTTLCAPIPTTAQSSPSPSVEEVEASVGLDRARRKRIQMGLRALGFNPGAPDGLFGPRTREAIGQWQSSRGEPSTGYLDTNTASTLLEAGKTATETAADLIAEALNVARSITDAETRAGALSTIAGAQTETGDLGGAARSIAEALNTARSIGDADSRRVELWSIARVQARAGDIAGALNTARSIGDDGWQQASALRSIAYEQAKAGDITAALNTARSIGDADARTMHLRFIAQALAEASDREGARIFIAEALSAAARIEDDFSRDLQLTNIAQVQAETLDVGPLDSHLDYKRVFRNGTGTISESGTFMHRTDDVEKGLRIATTSCRVPDDESERLDDDEQERREWEAERERLEWEAERDRLAREAQAHERLALEAARERQAQEAERQRRVQEAQRKRQEVERQRLAQEADRKRREAQRSLAQAKREREQEQERQRLARERERIREEAEAAELARMQRQYMEMQRRKEQEDAVSTGDILSGIATGIGIGALVGAAVSGDEEVFGAASQLLSGVAGGYSSGDSGGSNCEQIGLRMAQGLERLSNSNSGMCAIYRGTARIYRQTRSELTAAGCPMAGFDEAIRQAEEGARGACE